MAPKSTPLPFRYASPAANLAARSLKLAARVSTRQGVGPLRALAALGDPVEATVQPGLNTACWRFEGGKHKVAIGDQFLQGITRRPRRIRSPKGMDQHALAFGWTLARHEAWHGRVTDRDLPGVAAELRAAGVPFSLFNLAEDLRIEARARAEEGYEFKWWRWDTTRRATKRPAEALYWAVQSETDNALAACWAGDPRHIPVLRGFYLRIRDAKSSRALIPILAEWLKHWASEGLAPEVPPDLPRVTGAIGGEDDGSAGTGTPVAIDPTRQSRQPVTEQRGHSEHVPGLTKPDEAEGPAAEPVGPIAYFRSEYGEEPGPAQKAEADRLAARFADIIADSQSPRSARLATSGSRLHLAHVITGQADSFRLPGRTGGIPRALIVIDMSGSMSKGWLTHGREFVAACLRGIRAGWLDAEIHFSGNNRCARLPDDTSDATLGLFRPSCGTESIKGTLETLRAQAEDAEVVLVYTDGSIGGGQVDAHGWRKRGVDVIGALAADEAETPAGRAQFEKAMSLHFGRSLIARNGYELLGLIAQYLGERAG